MNFEKIGETNCRIDDIQNQDKILIGGSFYGKMDLAVTADLEQFEDFFQKVEINAQKVQENEAMKNWINQVAPNLDSTLFAHMWAFDNTLRKMYPNLSTNIDKRQNYYDEEGTKKLSQSVSDGVCMCAEISILAQAYFCKLHHKKFSQAMFFKRISTDNCAILTAKKFFYRLQYAYCQRGLICSNL